MFGIIADVAVHLIHSLLVVFVKLEGLIHYGAVNMEAMAYQ